MACCWNKPVSTPEFIYSILLDLIQPTVSKHGRRRHEALTPTNCLASSFLHPAPDSWQPGVAPFTLAIWCQYQLKEACTHKSAKTYAGNIFETRNLWPQNKWFPGHFYDKFGDPSCIDFWDIVPKNRLTEVKTIPYNCCRCR